MPRASSSITRRTRETCGPPVTCWFEDKNGKRTEFKCEGQENFLELFGKWDGKAKAPKAKVELTKNL